MKPISISEQMMYNTVRIITNGKSYGTGSFFKFKIGENEIVAIITNRHVVDDGGVEDKTTKSKLVNTSFTFHTMNDDLEPKGFITITGTIEWIFHKNMDLCYCYAGPIINGIKEKHDKNIFFITTDEKLIPSNKQLYELSALEEMTMVGYPIGLWDERNNFPIFRKGFTACHPAIDFNRDGVGLVDIACFPGSSGSPIFLLNEMGYMDKKGATHLGATRLLLMGYLFGGPRYKADGDIVTETILSLQKISFKTNLMINLGYYIKSSALLDFKNIISKDIQ